MRLLAWILTILFPGVIFFMLGRFLYGLLAFFLQASLIGWIPAMIWARITWNQDMGEWLAAKKAAKKKHKKDHA